ncbi:hypothetical protein V1512DRAFT_267128 [Lipomyces arxii]|uniref:uncharacterized protein n=1 Tax=Lipomyces arxii TaxID=56418 RepID=UPI0034CEE289
MHMKKLFGKTQSRSRSSSADPKNPYLGSRPDQDPELEESKYKPYAINSNPYNIAPSYTQSSVPSAFDTYKQSSPERGRSPPLPPRPNRSQYHTPPHDSSNSTYSAHPAFDTDDSSLERGRSPPLPPRRSIDSPYDRPSSRASSNRQSYSAPPVRSPYSSSPARELRGTFNQYSNASDYGRDDVSAMRQELMQKYRSKPTINENAMVERSNYDPSIMLTEEERAEQELQVQSMSYPQHDYAFEKASEQRLEEQDVEVDALKDQIRFTNKKALGAEDGALRYAEEAEASGLRTLKMLGEQSDQLSSAEGALAVTDNKTKLAEDYAAELKRLNKSILAVHVSNPFRSRQRLIEQETEIRENFRNQQLDREAQRKRQYLSQQRVAGAMGNTAGERRRVMTETERKYRLKMDQNKQELAAQSKYMFEPEEQDFVDEREINNKLDTISQASQRLNMMAKSINNEVTSQNERIQKLDRRTQDVEIDVHLNTARLARIT